MTVLAVIFGLTYPSSHTFWKVVGASGIAVILIAVVLSAIWLLSRRGHGPMR